MQELNEEHDALLARLDEYLASGVSSDEAMRELQIPVREFIATVADAGRDLYLDQERSAAQSLLHYWCNALTRAGVEYLPASLLPFDEAGGSTEDEVDFPFDLIGKNRRLRWDQYAAGRRLREDAKKVWDVMPLIAIVGSIGSGRGTALDEVIVPAVIEWMTSEAGVPPQLVHFPAEGGALGPLFVALRAKTSESKKPANNPLRRLGQGQTNPGGILLVIHDLGALLHDVQDNQWEEWLRALLEWARKPNGVVLVVNNSRLHLLTDHAEFQREVIKQQVTAVYDSAELREFVEMPARAAHVYFEEGVVERIVRNVQGQHGTLALLHFSLQRIWEVFRKRRGHKLIRHADYEQVSSGRTAVDRAAEEALDSLSGSLAAVEKLFLHLVTPALEGWDIHEVPIDKLRADPVVSERADAIVTAFVGAKILRFCEGEGGERRVALYHYVIAGCWARLQSWLEGAREKSLAHLLLPRVARRWARENMPGDSLWRGEMLSSVERQAAEKGPLEQRFITASVRARRWRRFSRTLPILMALIGVGLWVWLQHQAERAATKAATQLGIAQAQLKTERGERLLETDDPAGALLWFNDGEKPGRPEEWQLRRESIALRSLPQLLRLATLDGIKDSPSASSPSLNASASSVEYAPDGRHAVITARNLGENRGGLLLWDLEEALPRVVVKDRSYEKVKLFGPTAAGDVMVAAISAPATGTAEGRLEVWKWSEFKDSHAQPHPTCAADLNAFPFDLAVEETPSPGAPRAAGTLLAVGTGQGDDKHGSRLLLFELDESGQKLVACNDLEPAFAGRTNNPVVTTVKFSKDGHWLLSGGGDVNDERGEALLFWREERGKSFHGEPRRLKHDAPVANVDFSMDSTRFVTATGAQQRGAGEARLWSIVKDPGPFAELSSIPLRHRARVVEVRFSPDGRRLLTASQDGAARIWNAQSGEFNSVLEHEGWLYAARWSPDGRHVVTASRDGFARLWDANTGLLAWPKMAHTGTVSLAQFAPDGQSVFTGTAREFRVWCGRGGQAEPLPTLPQGTVADAVFSADGRWLATAVKRTDGSELGEVVVTNAENGKEHARLAVGGPVNKVVFSADGKILAAGGGRRGGRGGIIRLWDVEEPEKQPQVIVAAEPVVWLGFPEKPSPDIIAALLHTAISLEPGEEENSFRIGIFRTNDGKPFCPTFDARGQAAIPHEAADTKAQPLAARDKEVTINALALSADGKFLAVGGGSLSRKQTFLTIFDLASSREDRPPASVVIKKETHKHIEAITALAFDKAASRLISGSVDDWVRIFDFGKLRSNSKDACWREDKQNADISAVGFSADERHVFSCGYDGRVLVIDAIHSNTKPRALDHAGAVRSACFSADGKLLATGGDDRKARLWNIETGDLVGIFPLNWPLATVRLTKVGEPPGGIPAVARSEEHLLTTAFYYTQDLVARGSQRSAPPDTAGLGLGSSAPMRADTSAVTKRRVDARRWNIAATANDEWLDSLSARRLGPDGRIIAKQSKDLNLPTKDAAPLPDAEEAHHRTASLCEEQELWSAANWHLQRCNPGTVARQWQEIRIAFGAKEWPQVLKLCAAAPAELAQTPAFLKLKAETLMAGSGDAGGLAENLKTLREWEKVERKNIMVPLRIAEVQYLLGQPDEADQTLKVAIEGEQAKVKNLESETGALPSLWQRRAELCWLAMAARAEDQSWTGRYQEAALALLANFGDSADNGGVVAWPFALAPQTLWKDHPEISGNPKGFWEKIVDLADKAVEIDPSNFYRLNTLGALLVRGNRFEEAIPWLEESRRSWSRRPESNNKVESGRPLDWCFLALAHAGVASQPNMGNGPKRLYHQKRAEYFTGLVTARQSLNVSSGGSVWREELAGRELALLADEVQKTLSK